METNLQKGKFFSNWVKTVLTNKVQKICAKYKPINLMIFLFYRKNLATNKNNVPVNINTSKDITQSVLFVKN